MSKFRKKPVVIDAFKWTGDVDQTEDPEWIIQAIKEGVVKFIKTEDGARIHICTLEGWINASQGDFIIRGIAGEIYPCKPDIFKATYEEATSKKTQIDILAEWIMKNCSEEIGNEGAGDVAVRLLDKYHKALSVVVKVPFIGFEKEDALNMIKICSIALASNPAV